MKRITTKTNAAMAFVRIEDLSGGIEIVVFPRLFTESAHLWNENSVVLVEGQTSHKDGEWKILADRVKVIDLSTLGPDETHGPIQIVVQMDTITPSTFDELKALFIASPGERAVELVVKKGAAEKTVPTQHRITLTPELREALEQLLGQCILG
jgi:DNA polymerase-3 subunit alpha